MVVDERDDVGEAVDDMESGVWMGNHGDTLLGWAVDSEQAISGCRGRPKRDHIHGRYDLRKHGRSQLNDHVGYERSHS